MTTEMVPVNLDDDSDEAYLLQEGIALFADAETVPVISDAETYRAVATALVAQRGWIAKAEAWFKPMADKAYQLHREITGRRAAAVDGRKKQCAAWAKALGDYDTRIRREQALAQERAQEEARVAVEIAKRDGTPPVPVVVAVPAAAMIPTPKIEGMTMIDEWYAEVTDFKALCRAIADGSIPQIAMAETPPTWQSMLNDMAKKLKTMMAVPGVEAKSRRVPRRT